MKIDRLLIRFFILLSILFGAVLYYKYDNYFSCDNIEITIIGDKHRVGEVIGFSCNSVHARDGRWAMGDESDYLYGDRINHIYKYPGTYKVDLNFGGDCHIEKYIKIVPIKVKVDSALFPRFSSPKIAYVDVPVDFKDHTKGAKTWQWRFGESYGIDSKKRSVSYTYRTTGVKQITLIVNDKVEFAGKSTITILPAPKEEIEPIILPKKEVPKPKPILTSTMPVAPPLPKIKQVYKAKDIDNKQLEELLMLISEEKVEPKVLYPYTFGVLDIPVRANEKRISLAEFCKKIKGRKIKVKELEIMKNKETNCITFIKITYKRLRGGLIYI